MHSMNGQLTTSSDALNYMLAGNATITLVSKRTGTRYTFKVRQAKEDRGNGRPWFVSVLYGADNTSDFRFLSTIFADGDLKAGRNTNDTDPRHVAFGWALKALQSGKLPTSLEIWHEGTCGRCGRKLTVPESVSCGFGPECITKVSAAAAAKATAPKAPVAKSVRLNTVDGFPIAQLAQEQRDQLEARRGNDYWATLRGAGLMPVAVAS